MTKHNVKGLTKVADRCANRQLEVLQRRMEKFCNTRMRLKHLMDPHGVASSPLVSALIVRRECITFRHEMAFRGTLVEKLVSFVSSGEDALCDAEIADLDLACMRVSVARCIFQPLTHSMHYVWGQ